jgi:hypothetical protein
MKATLRASPDTTASGLMSRSNGIQNEQAHFQYPFNLAIPLSFDREPFKSVAVYWRRKKLEEAYHCINLFPFSG